MTPIDSLVQPREIFKLRSMGRTGDGGGELPSLNIFSTAQNDSRRLEVDNCINNSPLWHRITTCQYTDCMPLHINWNKERYCKNKYKAELEENNSWKKQNNLESK